MNFYSRGIFLTGFAWALLHDQGKEQRKGRVILLNKPVSKEIVSWHDSLSVGVDHIDKQHQYFINLITRIHSAIENSYTAKIVEPLLVMKAYTEVHFTDEENLMARKEYPRLDEHIVLHREFIRKTESFLDDLEQHPLAISSEVSNYLVA